MIKNHSRVLGEQVEFDFVIVGAGSAGCVLANRLSANPKHRVALLEAGGHDRSPWIHIPAGYFKTMGNPKTDWCYQTQPVPGLNGRSIAWPRGKVLGGSSSINGLLMFVDRRRILIIGDGSAIKVGADDVLPLFKRAENWEGAKSEDRGTGGPLNVSKAELPAKLSMLGSMRQNMQDIHTIVTTTAGTRKASATFK